MRSAGLLALLSVTACSPDVSQQSALQQIDQCRQVISFWAAPHRNMRHSVEQNTALLRVKVSMTMQAVLGELPGSGSCDYMIASDGEVAQNPTQITIGNTVHRSKKDLDDLLSLRKEFEPVGHEH